MMEAPVVDLQSETTRRRLALQVNLTDEERPARRPGV
jgi:hypothetical protein